MQQGWTGTIGRSGRMSVPSSVVRLEVERMGLFGKAAAAERPHFVKMFDFVGGIQCTEVAVEVLRSSAAALDLGIL